MTDPAQAHDDGSADPKATATTGGKRSRWSAFRGLPRWLRLTTYAALALLLVAVALTVVGVTVVRRPLPETTGELSLSGLGESVDVLRDDNGIPHLYGDSMSDLVMAQGYVQAQERFFEMDLRRHVTAGRLSEMFGEDGLETDKYIRTMGWRRVAEQELAILQPETRTLLQAYADGVNAYLDDNDPSEIAVEYTILGLSGLDYRPEDWTPVDSLAWLKAMAWDLRGNMDEEIGRVLTAVGHTDEEVEQLYPAYPYADHDPIVGQGAVVDGVFDQDATGGTRNPQRPAWGEQRTAPFAAVQRGLERLPELVGRGDGVGSNSWVVGGEHTATGEPLLANDPHLGSSLPGIWMQMGLHCRTLSVECPLDVSGFTFSGVPGVVIGHNSEIAWGFTNLGPDVSDLFLEKLRGEDYRYDRRWRPLQIRHETIKVHGGRDFDLTVRETRHGPLLSDVSPELSSVGANTAAVSGADEGYAVSLAWTALEPGRTADAIFALNLATDWPSFRAAAADFAVPAQNLVYADRAGHIGYQAPGAIPIRQTGNDGTVPSEGWRPENDWTGDYVPFDGLPNELDPDEGFIVTANQAVIGEDYPYFLTGDWDQGYRSQQIRSRIEASPELSVKDMSSIQLDDHNPMAPTLVPYLLHVPSLSSSYYEDGRDLLGDWDFRQSVDSAPAAYYNAVWRSLLRLTFHDELRESLQPDGGDRWYAAVTGLLREPTASWWDDKTTDDEVETRDDILWQAMRDARDDLTKHVALDPDEWTWGALHELNLRTSTLGESGVAPVEWLVNREGFETGGGASTVNATGWNAAEGYEVTAVPSMRMVIDLADLDASRWISLTGVSGHPASSHYVDQTELWAKGDTLPWPHTRDAVDAATEDELTLTP